MQNDTFILSRQGWLPIAVAGTFFILFTMTGLHFFQFIAGALLTAFLVLFRNPERNSPSSDPLGILSSMDGVVLGIEEILVNDELMKKITVLNSLWNVSILRAPFDGVAEGCRIRHGVSLGLQDSLAEMLNEKAVLSFRSPRGDIMYVEHTSAQSCFSIALGIEDGEKIKEGNRYGFLAKGRTILYLPSNTELMIHPGADIRAGENLIARFNG
jgi:phosphatidylserine decarboxylase